MATETKKTTAKKTAKKAVKKAAPKAASKSKKKETPGNELLKQALCYIPLVGPVLFFVENDKSAELIKHIKYGTFLFLAYILLNFILNVIHLNLGGLLSLAYLIAIGFLGYKAYTGQAVELDFIDKIEDEVKGKLK